MLLPDLTKQFVTEMHLIVYVLNLTNDQIEVLIVVLVQPRYSVAAIRDPWKICIHYFFENYIVLNQKWFVFRPLHVCYDY